MIGDDALVWIQMQGAHDAWHAEREVDVPAIPRLTAKSAA